MKRGAPMRRTRMKQGRTERRRTSQDEFNAIKPAILDRDAYSCIRCDHPAEVIHHRDPRGMGGASRRLDTHDPSVLLSLCNPCHDWIEHNRKFSEHMGWLVPMGVNPETLSTLWHQQWATLSHQCTVLLGATPPRLEL